MNYDIGINQSTLMKCRTEDFLAACGNVGFHSVELRLPKLRETLYTTREGTIENLLGKYNIRVVALNAIDDFALVPDNYCHALEAELKNVGELCKLVSCNLVVAPVGRWFSEPLEYNMVMNRSVNRVQLAAKILSDFDVTVGLEPIAFPNFSIRNLRDSVEIVRRCSEKNIVVVADIYNLANGNTVPDDMANFISNIGLIHINDSKDISPEERDVMLSRTFPGEGILSVNKWIESCLAAGYQGCFSLELFDNDIWNLDPDIAADMAYHKLEGFFKNLHKVQFS